MRFARFGVNITSCMRRNCNRFARHVLALPILQLGRGVLKKSASLRFLRRSERSVRSENLLESV